MEDIQKTFDPLELPLKKILNISGSLGYSIKQVADILPYSREEVETIIKKLNTAGTEEYNSYRAGATMADFSLFAKLQAFAGESNEDYEAYSAERRRQAINAAIEEKFGVVEE